MDSRLFGSIGFPICSLFFLIFIFIMYLNKKKFKNVENTVFIILLIHSFLCVFSEFLYVYFLSKEDASLLIQTVSCKMFLIFMVTWIMLYIVYIEVLLTKRYEVEIKKARRKKLITVNAAFELVCILLIAFLGLDFDVDNGLYSFAGNASLVVYALGGVGIALSIYSFLIRNDIAKSNQKFTMASAIVFVVITLVVQFLFPSLDFNIQNFQFAMLLLALFLTLENQDNKLLKEHEEQKKEADEVNKIQTEFLSSMSHEIRTPMNTIIGFSDVLINEAASNEENVKNDVKLIHGAAINLLELINNILDLSRIESGKEQLVEKEYDVDEFIVELDSIVKNKIENKKIKYSLYIDNNLPKRLNGDYVKVSKVISNLLFNVIDYTKEGQIVLNIGFNRPSESECTLLFNITSNGNEISREEYDKYYVGAGDSNNVNSIVLEYNIAKIYSNLLNGNLLMTSENRYNIGYSFDVSQMIIDPTPIGDITSFLTQVENINHDFSGKKILVVDDNTVNIKLIERFLSEMNIIVDRAESGKECIEKVTANQYDLIFLDHLMPVMDGVETLTRLKDLTNKLPPIVALTANSYAGIKEEYISLGFNDYLAKPVNREEIGKLLYTYLK